MQTINVNTMETLDSSKDQMYVESEDQDQVKLEKLQAQEDKVVQRRLEMKMLKQGLKLLGKYLASLVSRILPFRRTAGMKMMGAVEKKKSQTYIMVLLRSLFGIKSQLSKGSLYKSFSACLPGIARTVHMLIKISFIVLFYTTLYE